MGGIVRILMKRLFIFIWIVTGVLLVPKSECFAQETDDKLHIYGFTQVLFISRSTDVDIFADGNDIPFDYSRRYRSNSFSLHQINLFFQKAISDRTTFFLNLEASGSYSSRTPSGSLEIPEGWISHRFNDHLEVKAGLLAPRFNNLLEIKNRLPLFPYLIRPVLYETLISQVYSSEDYRPDKAYFQLSYTRSISNNLVFDAAFYVGNSEDSFLATKEILGEEDRQSEQQTRVYLGENMNTQLLFGGRVGVENTFSTFKFGVSGTIDEDNKMVSEQSPYRLPGLVTPDKLGEIPRYRLGIDLSFNFLKRFAFESEFMGVYHNHSEIRKIPTYRNANLNKIFQYSNLTFNISDQTFIYAGYSYNRDLTYDFISSRPPTPDGAGLYVATFGTGWRPFDNTVIKAQFFQGISGNNPNIDYKVTFLSLGISTIF